jgi:hypothetical protein
LLTLWQFLIRCHPAFEHDRSTDKLRGRTFGSRAILINKSLPLSQQATPASNRAAFQSLGGVANALHTSATQEFGGSFLDETPDAFRRVFRGLQPALLLLQLSRGDVRPFKHCFPRIGEGRCDCEGGLLANQIWYEL